MQVIDDGQVVMPLAAPGGLERGNGRLDPATPAGQLRAANVVLERSLSAYRGLYILRSLEVAGIPAINRYATASTCADKLLTTRRWPRRACRSPAPGWPSPPSPRWPPSKSSAIRPC